MINEMGFLLEFMENVLHFKLYKNQSRENKHNQT